VIAKPFDDLRHVRSRICSIMLFATAILALPATSASVYRSVSIGWQWEMGLHIATTTFIWVILIFRKSIPYTVRAGSLVFLFLLIGLVGFWNLGMIAGANPLLLLSPVLATVLFGKRLGIPFAIAMLLMMIVTAYSFILGDRILEIDANASAPYLPAWITYLLTVILAVATSIAAISMSNHHLTAALTKSRNSQIELESLNKDLENQVSLRTLELENSKKKAEQQARTDVLTGLNNRRAFFEYAELIDAQSRRYKHTYMIAMIDIDHFKQINDTFGHKTGDAALVIVANAIAQALRETDIIGRIGGEEFSVIMPETALEDGLLLAERLRKSIEQTVIQTPKGDTNLTISIGIAVHDDQNLSLEKVMANSDAALYSAKNAGRNKIQCFQESSIRTGT